MGKLIVVLIILAFLGSIAGIKFKIDPLKILGGLKIPYKFFYSFFEKKEWKAMLATVIFYLLVWWLIF